MKKNSTKWFPKNEDVSEGLVVADDVDGSVTEALVMAKVVDESVTEASRG